MEIIRRPSSDVDTLEGAIRHMLSVCNALPGVAINAFTKKYGKMHGHNLPNDFGTNVVMRQLIRADGHPNVRASVLSQSPSA